MAASGFVLFDTAIGRCGLAWGDGGVTSVQLPEGRDAETRARLAKRFPGAAEAKPPREVQGFIDDIVALLRGEAVSLSAVKLDMSGVPPFHRRVYELARTIEPGATLSYGDVATRLGAPGSARAVGQALGRNPFAIVVPCHRVLAAGGKMGGFSAKGGVATKLRMLNIEGARSNAQASLFEGDGSLTFDPDAALRHLKAADSTLARLIDATGPFRMQLKKTPSVFGALSEAIVYQQLNGKAAATIYGRVQALFPRARSGFTAEQLLRTPDEALRLAGLSRNKLLSMKDLAKKAVDGEIPTLAQVHAMDDETIIERLSAVRGVGRWTAEMFLMFRLGRPDVLPVDDYGVRKGYAVTYKKRDLPAPKELARFGEKKWKPYRTVASWYFWRAAEASAKKKPAAAS